MLFAMRIDHLVYYDADLSGARAHFAGCMDNAPAYGGEHPGEGTANAVLSLGPFTYLEILGRDVKQDESALDPEVRGLSGAGLYHWAVGGVDLAELATRAERAGLRGGALVPGGRVKPDGKWLGWTCWGLRDHGFGSLIPFFIDWMDSEHPAVGAPSGGQLRSLIVSTPRAQELRGIFGVLGLDIDVREAGRAGILATLESHRGSTELKSFDPVPRGYVI